jgi:maltose O-acetyltransferase
VLAVEVRRAAWNGFINGVAASGFMPRPLRAAIYRRAGMTIESWNIQPGCYIGPGKLSIGAMSFVNHRCFFDNSAPISIGKDVHVAMEVLFCTSTHEPGTPRRRAGRGTGKRISVGDGAWIGARATILPGVTVGAGAIIAAGSSRIERL